MANTDRQKKAYAFLSNHAQSQKSFSLDEMCASTEWKPNTAETYLKKQVRSVITKVNDKYNVAPHFVYLSESDFIERTSQKEKILPTYQRVSYDSILMYEFLMPLTREDLLKLSLDRLFYRDSLEEQLKLLDESNFHRVIPREETENDLQYIKKIAQMISKYFGGYSILHANGRFRADSLCTQQQAVGKRYIIDETTAIVRFIIPLTTSSKRHGIKFDASPVAPTSSNSTDRELELVRTLFFSLFAEVVVHSIQGEDQIWLVETLAGRQKLYTWEVS